MNRSLPVPLTYFLRDMTGAQLMQQQSVLTKKKKKKKKFAELECSVLRTTACVGGTGWVREWRFISSCVILFWLCSFWTSWKGEWLGSTLEVDAFWHGKMSIAWLYRKLWLFETASFKAVTLGCHQGTASKAWGILALSSLPVAFSCCMQMSSWRKRQVILVRSKPWP